MKKEKNDQVFEEIELRETNPYELAGMEAAKNVKGKKGGTVITFIAVVMFLLSFTLLGVVLLYSAHDTIETQNEKNRSPEEIVYTQAQLDARIYDAVEKAKTETASETEAAVRSELRDELYNTSLESYGIVNLLRTTFSDYVVFSESGGKFSYYPIDFSLKPLQVKNEGLYKDEITGLITYAEDGSTVTSKMGIDVSSFQKEIDWKKVKEAGVDFAIIRCAFRGYGSGKIVDDPYFYKNIEGALANDIEVGVYFFTEAINIEEAVEEAEYTLDMIKDYNVTCPVVIDIEAVSDEARTDEMTGAERTDCVIAFCDRIAQEGYTPMIYANTRYFIKTLEISRLEAYEKWFALYDDTLYFPYEISLWQYSASGTIDGIKGAVDLDISFGK